MDENKRGFKKLLRYVAGTLGPRLAAVCEARGEAFQNGPKGNARPVLEIM